MTKQQLHQKALEYMTREFGFPGKMVDEDCRDRWHERLGLLVDFIDEISPDPTTGKEP